jgi:putative PIN family toxin of toxin-antitoxin system
MIAAVLDVNLLISSVIAPFGFSRQIVAAWENARFTVFISEGIIAEIDDKLRLPRISRRYRVAEEDIVHITDSVRTNAQFVTVPPHELIAVTGDPEDDYVLATARLAGADYLVTGDHGLLRLGRYEGTRIVSPKDFMAILGQQGP